MAKGKKVMISTERTAGTISEGCHLMKILELEERDGPTGYPYINVTLQVTERSVDNDKRLWTVLSLSPKARFKIEEFLDAMEVKPGGEVDLMGFAGRNIYGIVQHEMYNGKLQSRIDRFVTPADGKEMMSAMGVSDGPDPAENMVGEDDFDGVQVDEFSGEDIPF